MFASPLDMTAEPRSQVGDHGAIDLVAPSQGGAGQGVAAGARRRGDRRGGPSLRYHRRLRAGLATSLRGEGRRRRGTHRARLRPAVLGTGGHGAGRGARHPRCRPRRRIDARDDALDGGTTRNRQGHRGPHLAQETHDYKRNGTTDLFAALNVATGQVLTDCRSTHTAADVLRFFELIDLHVAKHLDIHVVLDNLATH